jgi:hypothetical protein
MVSHSGLLGLLSDAGDALKTRRSVLVLGAAWLGGSGRLCAQPAGHPWRVAFLSAAPAPQPGRFSTFMTDRKLIIDQALRHKLPTMWEWAEQVRDGGLMAYATSLPALYDRVASYVDRLLKGARAADLPVEQPATFALVVNQKTARTIGLTLPRELLLRADEVIE